MNYLSLATISGLVALFVSWVPTSAEIPAEAVSLEPGLRAHVAAPRHSDELCSGGVANLIEVSPRVTGFHSSSSGGDSLQIELSLESHYGAVAAVIASVEVFDDRGRPVTSPRYTPVRTITPHRAVAHSLDTPAGLRHGFYRLSANIASESVDRSVNSFDLAELFLRVDERGVVPISHDEWLMQSGANLAVQSFDDRDPERATRNPEGK